MNDEEVEVILPSAAYALSKIHMHLVHSGYDGVDMLIWNFNINFICFSRYLDVIWFFHSVSPSDFVIQHGEGFATQKMTYLISAQAESSLFLINSCSMKHFYLHKSPPTLFSHLSV